MRITIKKLSQKLVTLPATTLAMLAQIRQRKKDFLRERNFKIRRCACPEHR